MVKRKRGYSRAFTPKGEGRSISLQRIPTPLFLAVRDKARREGVSVRAVLLQALATYAEQPVPDQSSRSIEEVRRLLQQMFTPAEGLAIYQYLGGLAREARS